MWPRAPGSAFASASHGSSSGAASGPVPMGHVTRSFADWVANFFVYFLLN
jgi:hypothetical protein